MKDYVRPSEILMEKKKGAATECLSLVWLVKKVASRHVDPGCVMNSVCVVKNSLPPLAPAEGGRFARRSAP